MSLSSKQSVVAVSYRVIVGCVLKVQSASGLGINPVDVLNVCEIALDA